MTAREPSAERHVDDEEVARTTNGEWVFAYLFVAAFVGICLYGLWHG